MNFWELVNLIEVAVRKTTQSNDSYRCFLPDLAGLAANTFVIP